MNERFADADAGTHAMHWVHDYHLMLVPSLLCCADATGPIGFFLHVPFPPPEILARLPWRERVLDGLLAANAVSFQTEAHRDNFVRTCERLHDDVTVSGETIHLEGRRIRTAAHPISIDARAYADQARSGAVERHLSALHRQVGSRRVLLGVDRLDYTKGIIERLRALELLLEQRPALGGRIALLQIAVPSRGEVREYRELRRSVEELVGRINGRFTTPGGDVPVYYHYRGIAPERLLAYTPRRRLPSHAARRRMNLVAKEFVVAQGAARGMGVLVLSDFAGAAAQLREALPCNPFDVEALAGTIELALELDEDDRRGRIRRMAAAVAKQDVYQWLNRELRTLRELAAHGN